MGIYSHKEQAVSEPPIDAVYAESGSVDYQDTIINVLAHRRATLNRAIGQLVDRAGTLNEVAVKLVEALSTGHKVLVAGNGGSAAEAQHFAAELVGRFKRDRAPYAVVSLTTDTSIMTSIANDYGYQDVFARQVRALGQAGDLFIAFSTSGESENLVQAALAGRERLVKVIAITGDRPSRLEKIADLTVQVPVVDTATTQELHMVVTHILCDIAETQLASGEDGVSL